LYHIPIPQLPATPFFVEIEPLHDLVVVFDEISLSRTPCCLLAWSRERTPCADAKSNREQIRTISISEQRCRANQEDQLYEA